MRWRVWSRCCSWILFAYGLTVEVSYCNDNRCICTAKKRIFVYEWMKEYLGTKEWVKVYCIGAHVFQNFRGHLQILGAGQVTWSKFRAETPQLLGTTVKILLVTPSWYPGFACRHTHTPTHPHTHTHTHTPTPPHTHTHTHTHTLTYTYICTRVSVKNESHWLMCVCVCVCVCK